MELLEVLGALGIGGLVGALLTWWTSTRDLALRRRTRTIEAFLAVASLAHGYRPGAASNERVGTGEQMAAMYLLADLSNRDRWLKKAGEAHLDEVRAWLSDSSAGTAPRLRGAAEAARKSIK